MPAAVTVDLTKLMKRFSAKELEAKQVKFAMSVAEDMRSLVCWSEKAQPAVYRISS